MRDTTSYDPRALANLILDFADNASLPVGHLVLQKLLYFAHASFLIQRGRPLVSGIFEGWRFGPVQPATYDAFKTAGDQPIQFRAKGRDILTGAERDLEAPTDPDVRLHVMQVVSSYGRLSPGRLVELSHAPGGPWDHAVNNGDGRIALGARITDDMIRARFAGPARSIRSVEEVAKIREPEREEEPAAKHRLG